MPSTYIQKEMPSTIIQKDTQSQYNPFRDNKENNNLESNIMGLLNKQRNKNKVQQSTVHTLQSGKENLERLNEKHQNLIGSILAEEERYLSNHKTHIDDMVEMYQSVNFT
jgi:hypothetical protein